MRKAFQVLTIFTFIFVSCDKPILTKDKIIGEWQLESIEDKSKLFSSEDVTEEFDYLSLQIFQDGELELLSNNNGQVIYGEWDISHESYTTIQIDSDGDPYPTTTLSSVVDISWDQTTEFPISLDIGILTKKKLNLMSKDKTRLYFKFIRF